MNMNSFCHLNYQVDSINYRNLILCSLLKCRLFNNKFHLVSLVYNSNWHWLDGTVVDDSVITWCSNSTYITAIGTQCAAYDSTLQCVNNYLCNSLLPAPCVSGKN